MGLLIIGYQITEILYETENIGIYRAVQESEQVSVIIKKIKTDYPKLEQINQLKYEYQILQLLNHQGAVIPIALEINQNNLAIIIADFGCQTLKSFLKAQCLDIATFLNIALKLATSLAQLHQNNIIHQSIQPHNILINPQTYQVKMLGFSLESYLDKQNDYTYNSNLLADTLAYISPEQTGRMNCVVDYRTDFYSLGIIFYEMLTGKPPFIADHPLDLIYAHIAKIPLLPTAVNPKIPLAISDIIMKLLAKNTEDRYQNYLGLKSDLERCFYSWQSNNKIDNFTIGQLDLYSQLRIPQKLYGREAELAALINAFERVSCGTSEVMLISGYSGVGKSSLVNEIHQIIAQHKCHFITGKFDQFKRNVPYALLIEAFQELIQKLLTENSANIATWRSKILEAVSANGQLIIDVIPAVERIIGTQTEVTPLGLHEAQNRFKRVFQQFIHVFCQPEYPLVIFLDDLQWADTASLKLIQLLIDDPESKYLLILGAYRDHEVHATHPLMSTLEAIQKSSINVNHLVLRTLQIHDVNQLVSDTLHTDISRTQPLTDLLFAKTQGNPFFLKQLLKALQQENLLRFNFIEASWQWDTQQIQSIDITDNVVELMVNQIQKLSTATQNILKLAACIGDKFTLDVLSVVHEKSVLQTTADLWEALQSGLVLPEGETAKIPVLVNSYPDKTGIITYKFLHDRVQQASYSLIPEAEQQLIHVKIGRSLLQNTTDKERYENIFTLVNHLNYGAESLTLESEKIELIELNLLAGQKAKAATAYESAIRYFQQGLSLLTNASWDEHYQLTLTIYQEAAEVAFLIGEFEQMEQLAMVIIQQANTQLEKVKIYELRIKSCEVQRKLIAAVQLGLQVLEILGIKLPASPTFLDIQQAINQTTANLATKDIEDLVNLQSMTDVNQLAALRLIASLVPAAYQSAPALFILMACQEVNLSIQHGKSPFSASGFADYGVVFSGLLQDIDAADKFGKVALALLENLDTSEVKSQVLFKVATFIIHWKNHLRETLPLLENAYSSGLELGDLVHTGYAASNRCQYLFWLGVELKNLEQEMAKSSQAIAQIHQETALTWHQVFHQVVLNLIGLAANPCKLIGTAYNEEQLLPLHIQANERTVVCYVFLNKLILCYLFGELEQAKEYAIKAGEYLDGVTGWFNVPQFYFYDSLLKLAIYTTAEPLEQAYLLAQVQQNQAKMRKWADHAPMNFQHKYELVAAEIARVLGENWQAVENYDCAIATAQAQGYIQEAALANELAAKFYFDCGKNKIAQPYLTDAYYGYLLWGAIAKVQDLESQYSQFLSHLSTQKVTDLGIHQTITPLSIGIDKVIDVSTVIKASQALSGEIYLEKLLTKLMQIAIENAGAEKGFLILQKNSNLYIEASGNFPENDINIQHSLPLSSTIHLPISVINYVYHTQENIVLHDATNHDIFAKDEYIIKHQPKSILCTPIVNQGKLIGILYLENNLIAGAFTSERVEVLQLLSSQAAISLENARLYNSLEEYNRTLEIKVAHRTLELQEKNLLLQKEIQERQKAEEVAASANRAKSEFLANMSHELRTPLNGILGYTQILQKDKNLNSQQKNGIDIIYQCSKHLLTLINDILDISKIEARKMELYPEQFHFSQFLDSIVQMCRIRAEQKGLRLLYQPTSSLPKIVYADERRLRQVLINLLSNAVKFTQAGYVNFHVGYVPLYENWQLETGIITTEYSKSKIRFYVEDTGIGIATEQLEEIFLPFKQVGQDSLKIEGTGLGLAISRQLVQLMDSELNVKSNLGKGSAFWLDIDLPEIIHPTHTNSTEKGDIVAFTGEKRKILVVDDKPENRSILVNLLQPLGFITLEAIDGIDAVNKAREFQPDVIFMDLVMNRMDGFEATRRLRMLPELEKTVVIAISASVFDVEQQQSQEVGCNDFLPKPIQIDDLLEKLQFHLNLQWIYQYERRLQTTPTHDHPNSQIEDWRLLTPSSDELTVLLDLAMRGNLRAIAQRVEKLEELDEKLIPFANYLRQLVKGFKGKQIVDFLKQF
ncbi:serine/threonine protein kinase [Nostoc sp. CENA543]|uniref:hybrid sensor histidine kinase/response regulator n=1 Tax=Nostoc sp. CENA543 TaxID=1869241 RepID=UPI000CA25563|nr:hybrid sensor histidine kinase/response regulator [Nostoc sp. CENA543]AUT01498.1 serine/threonine protein kinase [Nostoc sp. CENA543]